MILKNIRKIFGSYFIYIIIFGLFVAASLIPFYRGSHFILGQEGNNIIYFGQHLQKNWATWQSHYGTGYYNLLVNQAFPVSVILPLLEKITHNLQVVNFVFIYSVYFLPFLCFMLIGKNLKVSPFSAFLVSSLYVLNPFTLSFFWRNISPWNSLAMLTLPICLLLLLRFYDEKLKLFFLIGFFNLLLAFSNINPPLIVINQIAILISVITVTLYYGRGFRDAISRYLIAFAAFLLFNFWWIYNWLTLLTEANKLYNSGMAISWLKYSVGFYPSSTRLLTLMNLFSYPLNRSSDLLTQYYSNSFVLILLIIPFGVILYVLWKQATSKYLLLLSFTMVLVGFLSQGVKGVFGSIYELLIIRVPYFSIFKSASEKWGVLFVFLFASTIIFAFKNLVKDKHFRVIKAILFVYLIINGIALATGKFMSDAHPNDSIVSSKQFVYKPEYRELKETLEEDKEIYRTLVIPGSLNYQVAMQIEGRNFYTGYDPIISNINKNFITPYSGWSSQNLNVLYDNVKTNHYRDILGLYNIKKILINNDLYPWFGFAQKNTLEEIEKEFESSISLNNNIMSLYDVRDSYLPRFYIPKRIIYSPQSTEDDLLLLANIANFQKRDAFFLKSSVGFSDAVSNNEQIKNLSDQIITKADIQNSFYPERLRAGNNIHTPSGVLFPFARWNPDGPFYSYIKNKENKVTAGIKGSILEIDNSLFFASKRVTELTNWSATMKISTFNVLLKEYLDDVNNAINHLAQLGEEKNSKAFDYLVKIEVAVTAQRQRLEDVFIRHADVKRKDAIEKAINEIEENLKNVAAKYYSNFDYTVNIESSGQYNLFFEKTADWADCNLKFSAEDRENVYSCAKSSVVFDNNWLLLGSGMFSTGSNTINLEQGQENNVISDDWRQLPRFLLGEESINVQGSVDYSVTYQDLENWQANTNYFLSLKYISPRSSLRVAIIEDKEIDDLVWFNKGIDSYPDKKNLILNKVNPPRNDWEDLYFNITSGKRAKSARIILSLATEDNVNPELDYSIKDLKLIPIIEPKMVLQKQNNVIFNEIPSIEFTKINNTQYLVNIENATNPYFLIFSESYNPGWKLFVRQTENSSQLRTTLLSQYFDGEIKELTTKNYFISPFQMETVKLKPLREDRHIVMNSFANAWLVNPEDSDNKSEYQILIEYTPQRRYYISVLLSMTVIVISLGTFIIGLRRRKNETKIHYN